MRKVMLVVCVAVGILGMSGCGSAGASSTENVNMQSGQWELVVTPDNGSTTMLLDANLSGTNAQFSATNAQIFQPSQIGLIASTSPIYCSSLNIDANVKKNNLRANLEWAAATESFGHFGDLSGELAANGQSISNGNYSGGICSVALNPEVSGPQIKGKLTGYTIAPVNGTYSGTLTNSVYGADVVTFTIAQNPDFSLKMSGTSVVNGVTTAIVGSSNSVTGGLVFLQGTAENVNGSNYFNFSGHVNPTASQLTVTIMSFNPRPLNDGEPSPVPAEMLTGILTKQ
jgi:hypothetical protein